MPIDSEVLEQLGATPEQITRICLAYRQLGSSEEEANRELHDLQDALRGVAREKIKEVVANLGHQLVVGSNNEPLIDEGWGRRGTDPELPRGKFSNDFHLDAQIVPAAAKKRDDSTPYYTRDGCEVKTNIQISASNSDYSPDHIQELFDACFQAASDCSTDSQYQNYILGLKNFFMHGEDGLEKIKADFAYLLDTQTLDSTKLKAIIEKVKLLHSLFLGNLAIALWRADTENNEIPDEEEYEEYLERINVQIKKTISAKKNPILINIHKIENPNLALDETEYIIETLVPNSDESSASRGMENLMFSNDWTVVVETVKIKHTETGCIAGERVFQFTYDRSSSQAKISYEYDESGQLRQIANKQVQKAARRRLKQRVVEKIIAKAHELKRIEDNPTLAAEQAIKTARRNYERGISDYSRTDPLIVEAARIELERLESEPDLAAQLVEKAKQDLQQSLQTLKITQMHLTLLSNILTQEQGLRLVKFFKKFRRLGGEKLANAIQPIFVHENEYEQLDFTTSSSRNLANKSDIALGAMDIEEILRRIPREFVQSGYVTKEKLEAMQIVYRFYYCNYMINKISRFPTQMLALLNYNRRHFLNGNIERRDCLAEYTKNLPYFIGRDQLVNIFDIKTQIRSAIQSFQTTHANQMEEYEDLSELLQALLDDININKEDIKNQLLAWKAANKKLLKKYPQLATDLMELLKRVSAIKEEIRNDLQAWKDANATKLKQFPNLAANIDDYIAIERHFSYTTVKAHVKAAPYEFVRWATSLAKSTAGQLGFKIESQEEIEHARIIANLDMTVLEQRLAARLGVDVIVSCKSATDRTGLFALYIKAKIYAQKLIKNIVEEINHGIARLMKEQNFPGTPGWQQRSDIVQGINDNSSDDPRAIKKIIKDGLFAEIGRLPKKIFTPNYAAVLASMPETLSIPTRSRGSSLSRATTPLIAPPSPVTLFSLALRQPSPPPPSTNTEIEPTVTGGFAVTKDFWKKHGLIQQGLQRKQSAFSVQSGKSVKSVKSKSKLRRRRTKRADSEDTDDEDDD